MSSDIDMFCHISKDIDFEKMFKSRSSFFRFEWGNPTQFLTDNFVPSDIFLLSGKGATLQTNKGELIDLCSMTVNCVLGQNDPWVKANFLSYLSSDEPSFHSTKFGSEYFYKIPQRLSHLQIAGIKNSRINHRQCNGSDVTELAVKMAHYKRGIRNQIISFRGSYHGQNMTSFLISETQIKHRFMAKCQTVKFLPAPSNTHNGNLKLSDQDTVTLEKLDALAPNVFAIIIEPIQMNNNVNVIGVAFMKGLYDIAKEHNICLIFDEVQTAFGWLGTLSAAEKYEVVPDILCAGKALTSGYGPLAVTVSNEKYAHLEYGTGEKTGGGDIRSLIAANAVIDRLVGIPVEELPDYVHGQLREELTTGLLSCVPQKVRLLDSMLKNLADAFPNKISEIRGEQFIRGIMFDKPDTLAEKVTKNALKKGVFIRYTKNTIIIKPPIVITKEEMSRGISIIYDLLADL